MYWTPAYRIAPIADCMGLNRFETIKRYFHVNNNVNQPGRDDPNYDPLYKVRPLFNHVRENCRNVAPEVRQCIDEQMVKFKGKSRLRRYMPKKPIRWGFKIIARCGASGMIYDFYVDGDTSERPQNSIGFTGDIVVQLCNSLPSGNYFLYTDRFYTSLPMLKKLLREKQIHCIGTILPNRLKSCPLKNDRELPQRVDS